MSMFDKLGDLLNEKLTAESSEYCNNTKRVPLGGQLFAADATDPEKTQKFGDVADAAFFLNDSGEKKSAEIIRSNQYYEDKPVKLVPPTDK